MKAGDEDRPALWLAALEIIVRRDPVLLLTLSMWLGMMGLTIYAVLRVFGAFRG